MRPFAHPQRLLEQLVEDPTGGAGLLGGAQRRAYLPEDLTLTDDHRVQPARHGEDVLDRAVLVVHVQVPGQFLQREAAVPRQQLGHLRDAGVELLDVGDDLDPVAGGHHHGLVDGVAAGDVLGELAGGRCREHRPLQEAHRRGAVAQADDENAHDRLTPRAPARRPPLPAGPASAAHGRRAPGARG
jgi:hypothetical protein